MMTRRQVLAGLTATAASAQTPKPDKRRNTPTILPEHLRCEYLFNPLGIDEPQPRLSWELKSLDTNARGLEQTAFQVLVASTRT